jgi:4-hydroxybenzoyl-CoA thioesterase
MSDPFERPWMVRFSDADPFGIAHYPRIVDALHETSDMFMEGIGYPFWEISGERGFGLPLVEMNFEFERMMDAGDEVTIALTPDPGGRSVRFDYTGRVDGDATFSGYEQRVCADREGSREIPDDLRAALEAYTTD